MQNDRLDVKDLYIFGAGASYGLSQVDLRSRGGKKKAFPRTQCPLDASFLKRLSKTYGKGQRGWKKKSWDFLEENWIERDVFEDQGLESAVLERLSNYSFLHTLNRQRVRGKKSNEDFLHHLSHLMSDYLFGCWSNRSGNTMRLMERIFPKDEDIAKYSNRIITFNYDILMDRVLLDRGLSPRKIYFNKIMPSKPQEGKSPSGSVKDGLLNPLLIKMHGSINWRCERKYVNSIINEEVVQEDHPNIWFDSVCPSPSDDDSPLIIPPVPAKPITDVSIFKFLWTKAYEYIHEAENIYIIGYSCPHTDVLARAMFSKFNNRKLKNITIVDPNAGILKSYREMVDQGLATRARWHYFSSIDEFIEGV